MMDMKTWARVTISKSEKLVRSCSLLCVSWWNMSLPSEHAKLLLK